MGGLFTHLRPLYQRLFANAAPKKLTQKFMLIGVRWCTRGKNRVTLPVFIHAEFTLSVDPGLRGCGCAFFDRSKLAKAFYVKNPNVKDRGPLAHQEMARAVTSWAIGSAVEFGKQHNSSATIPVLAVEFPQAYRVGQSKGDPNDLLDVAGVCSAVVTDISRTFGGVAKQNLWYLPAQWKGQVPKTVMTERILSRLSGGEEENIERVGAKDHNTIDAIGIGLFALGRMKRGGS